MKKREAQRLKKLVLHRETVKTLTDRELPQVFGAMSQESNCGGPGYECASITIEPSIRAC